MSSRSPRFTSILGLLAALCLTAAGSQAGTLSLVNHSRWVEVKHVYDGDTFRTVKGEKVRLLGINTPEIAYNDKPGQPLGSAAKRRLTTLVGGELVELRMDSDKRDDYGRTLAQVYKRDGTWINGLLVREGLALVYTFAPNFRWTNQLLTAEAEARASGLGIWSEKRFQVLESSDIANRHIGQFRLVRGKISDLDDWRFRLGKLNISVPIKSRPWFKKGLSQFKNGQNVIVRGTIRSSRGGELYLALHSPYDIE